MTHSRSALLAVLAMTCAVGACRSNPVSSRASENAWATVNGREITREEVEKAYRREAPLTPQQSEDEALMAKLSMLNEMIVQDLLVEKARALKIEVADTELDTAYAEAKKNIPDETFNKELAARNLTAADMRENLRLNLIAQKVIEREVTSKISVTDQDITAFYEANRAQFNRTEDAYRVAQIAVTPLREQPGTNRTGSDATTPEEARAKAQMLMERLKAGAEFAELAADFSEDAQSAQRGGDLGFLSLSQVRQAPPALRDAVLQSAPGSVRLVSIGNGHTILLVVGKETAGQKDLSMPEVKEAITANLRGRRDQVMRAAYLTALRNDAVVVNHLADRLVQAQGKMPSLAPKAP